MKNLLKKKLFLSRTKTSRKILKPLCGAVQNGSFQSHAKKKKKRLAFVCTVTSI